MITDHFLLVLGCVVIFVLAVVLLLLLLGLLLGGGSRCSARASARHGVPLGPRERGLQPLQEEREHAGQSDRTAGGHGGGDRGGVYQQLVELPRGLDLLRAAHVGRAGAQLLQELLGVGRTGR